LFAFSNFRLLEPQQLQYIFIALHNFKLEKTIKMNNREIKISLFYCSNSFSTEEINECSSRIEDVQLNAISLPCSGRINLLYILKAIETVSDGVILLTCKIGECKYLQGNLRAQKRIEAVDDLLDETGIGRGCVKCVCLEEGHKIETLVNEINKFCKHLQTKTQSIKEIV
jgi:coenzyme F420-reducing hydrogenase delta subunit